MGISYFVDDFWDSHGAGFQSYATFFHAGGMNRMPEAVEQEIRAYLKMRRARGGVVFRASLECKTPGLTLWYKSFSVDGTTVGIDTGLASARDVFFEGSVAPGAHALSWALTFTLPGTTTGGGARYTTYGKCTLEVPAPPSATREEVRFVARSAKPPMTGVPVKLEVYYRDTRQRVRDE